MMSWIISAGDLVPVDMIFIIILMGAAVADGTAFNNQ
jgi:hypothetical protein